MATIDSLKEILNENLDIEPEKVVESATLADAAAYYAVAFGRGHCLWWPSPSFVLSKEAASFKRLQRGRPL